jgi:Zn-dependent protease
MGLLHPAITRVILKLYRLHHRLCYPQPTRFDVHFRVLGFPVHVHPAFWIPHVAAATIAALADLYQGDPWWPLVFPVSFACTAGSILAHELGHVLAVRRFGAYGEIVLTCFGGFAHMIIVDYDLTRRQRVLIALAGPTVSLAAAAVALAAWVVMGPSAGEIYREIVNTLDGIRPPTDGGRTAGLGVLALACINLVGVANLVPIPPSDGWWIAREVIGWVRARRRASRDADDPEWWRRV